MRALDIPEIELVAILVAVKEGSAFGDFSYPDYRQGGEKR